MEETPNHTNLTACRCGLVALRVEGPPIARAVCYCESCQEAGLRIGRLPGGSPVLEADSGTDYVLFRKDRIRCEQGGEHLEELRLRPGSPTRRLVAGCCNTAMFLDFSKGHWVTLYRGRIAGSAPPLQMRIMAAEKREDVTLANDVPVYPGRAGRLIWKLMTSWAAMGFRLPTVKGVPARARAIQDSAAAIAGETL